MCPKNPTQSQLWKAATFQSTYTLLSCARLQTRTAACRQACYWAKPHTHTTAYSEKCISEHPPHTYVHTHPKHTYQRARVRKQHGPSFTPSTQGGKTKHLLCLQFALIEKCTNAEVKKKKRVFPAKKARRSNTHAREKGREDTHAQTLQLAFLQHLPI